jgi:DNA-directed RNA polymerase specialized sigma subunit
MWKERFSVSKLDPRFWEIVFAPDQMDKFSEQEAIWRETDEERQLRYEKEDRKHKVTPLIMEIIENDLTEMQRNCIKMHFLCQRTREEIAYTLGISRRVVTQHIYGIIRQGRRVGGGIKKIRKICEKRGISI